jgi:hypothetical protein
MARRSGDYGWSLSLQVAVAAKGKGRFNDALVSKYRSRSLIISAV